MAQGDVPFQRQEPVIKFVPPSGHVRWGNTDKPNDLPLPDTNPEAASESAHGSGIVGVS